MADVHAITQYVLTLSSNEAAALKGLVSEVRTDEGGFFTGELEDVFQALDAAF